MEKRMKGQVLFQRSCSVPFISRLVFLVVVVIGFGLALLPPGSLPPIIDGFVGRDNDEITEVQNAVTPSVTQKPPTQTPTKTLIHTNTPTATLNPTSIPTPTPRVWPEEEFEDFLVLGPGRMLLLSGWKLYDEVSVFDDYPCFVDILSCTDEEREQSVSNAYSQINDANFYCEWACQGFARNFGYWAPYPREKFWEGINSSIGDPEKEPYCSQFSGSYEYFSCDQPVPRPTIIPLEDYDWTKE